MAAPLTVLLHGGNVVSEIAIFFLIEKGFEKLLVSHHVLTSLLSHDNMGLLSSIDLVRKCPEQTIPVSLDIPEFDPGGCEFFVEICVVL